MPRKWNVHVVSQNRSDKARSNWRSLYSWVSLCNKASKKVWKPVSLMMFLISGDNISYMPFNIWRLPRLLRFCKTKFGPSSAWSKITCPPKFSTPKLHVQNFFFMIKNLILNKNFPWPKISCPTKNFPMTKNLMPNKKFFMTKNHIPDQKFSMFKNHIPSKKFPWPNHMSKNFPWQKLHVQQKF